MRIVKTFGAIGALITAALVGGTLIGSAAAESPSTNPTADGTDAGQYCQSFRSHLADALGTDDAGLESAFRSAAEATVDEAVAAGDLSKERADAIRSRLADADLDGCAGIGRPLIGHPGLRAGRLDPGAAAADALGMQPSELATKLRGGTSLQDVAKAQGVDYDSVKKAVLDAAKEDLDKAVAAGRITAEREQAMLDRLETSLDAGMWPPLRRHIGPGKPDAS